MHTETLRILREHLEKIDRFLQFNQTAKAQCETLVALDIIRREQKIYDLSQHGDALTMHKPPAP